MKTKKEILKQIDVEIEHLNISLYKNPPTKYRNNIRLLQWVLGVRTRPYPEGEGLMQREDAKALKKENELRIRLGMKIR